LVHQRALTVRLVTAQAMSLALIRTQMCTNVPGSFAHFVFLCTAVKLAGFA